MVSLTTRAMTQIQSCENIVEFAESIADTQTVYDELSILSDQECRDLNKALAFVGDDFPKTEWGSEIRRGEPTRAFAEIVLMWHLRRELGRDAVDLNAEYTDTGKDFDLRVVWNNHEYWIDVRTPEGGLGEIEEKGGGWIAGDSVGASITNKLEKQFKDAKEALPDDAILVLAVYLKAGAVDQNLMKKYLHEIDQRDHVIHPSEYCDAFFEYMYYQGRTTIDVREFTNKGKRVTELRDKLLPYS